MLDIPISGVSPPIGANAFVLPERKPSSSLTSWHVEQGATLMFEGARRSGIFRIVEGCICLSLPLEDGRRQILDVLGPGHFIGAHLSSSGRCSAIALTSTRLRRLSPTAEDHVRVDALQQMLWRARSHAALLGRRTMSERVAAALLDLAGQFAFSSERQSGGETTFPLHLTRAELADWLGLTLASVSRCLNAFKRRGLIAFDDPRLVTIRDREPLATLASGIPVSAHRSSRRLRRDPLHQASHSVASAVDRQAS